MIKGKYVSTAKRHSSLSPEYMGVCAEQTPPYIPAEALVWQFFSGVKDSPNQIGKNIRMSKIKRADIRIGSPVQIVQK